MKYGLTRAEEVLKILCDYEWHKITEFHNPKTGSSGDRRLRELRQKGYPIIKRQVPGSKVFEYRLQTLMEVYEQYFPKEKENERQEDHGIESQITGTFDALPRSVR